MKVALEGSSLFFKKYTGIPFYIHNLYLAFQTLEGLQPTLAFRLKKKFSSHTPFHKKLLENSHVWHLNDQLLSRTKFDVSHSLHTPFLNLKKTVKIATVHDLAVHLPQFRDFEFASEYFKKKRLSLFEQFSKKADAIITVSEATKNDFLHFFNFPEEKIHVIPLAPSLNTSTLENPSSTILRDYELEPKTYFIAMGGVSLRKNTFNLIKAYHISNAKNNFKLVITGKIEVAQEMEVRRYVTSNQLENKVIFTKYLSNPDLQKLYINARAFLFPTFYEGFGIPILEAMIAGLPVLTSSTGAAPETAGNFAVLVDPFLPESIAEGIDRLQEVKDGHLENAKTYAKGFTWEKTAKSTAAIYKKYM